MHSYADKGNNRISILNPTLTCALPIDGGLIRPQSIHLDESRGRLYVGECGGKRMLVFDNVINGALARKNAHGFFGPIPQKIINKKYRQYTSSQNYL